MLSHLIGTLAISPTAAPAVRSGTAAPPAHVPTGPMAGTSRCAPRWPRCEPPQLLLLPSSPRGTAEVGKICGREAIRARPERWPRAALEEAKAAAASGQQGGSCERIPLLCASSLALAGCHQHPRGASLSPPSTSVVDCLLCFAQCCLLVCCYLSSAQDAPPGQTPKLFCQRCMCV